ncbi:MAG: response regulator [Sphaerospermopsis sp. SIO1G2]|nr:response regulator [Sphaerospermopsis sp. SIO1G2]
MSSPLDGLITELENVLVAGNWQAANEITFALFHEKIPKDLENPGLIHYGDLDKIPDHILREIDRLWVYYSQGRFGFSVQWLIYYQVILESRINNDMEWQDNFREKVGRSNYILGYNRDEVNFDLDFKLDLLPPGYLPWFFWYDSTNTNLRSGIIGGGGIGWEAILFVASLLERCGIIYPENKVWSRAELTDAISKGECNFCRGNFQGIDLQGLDLSACYFIKSDFSYSNLSNCKLNQTNFYSANLYEANLENVKAENTCFQKANLEGTIFTGSRLKTVNFFQCSAFRTVFDESNWQNVNAKSVNFWGASFYDSKLENCKFQNSNASYSNWQEAFLKTCDFTDSITTSSTLNMTDFIGINWSKQQYQEANLSNVNLTLCNAGIEVGKELLAISNYRKPRIMIIDDSLSVRELLKISFQKAGYEVITVRDGLDAWERLNSNLHYDFIFCDIEMPRMDGIEFVSRMKKDEQLKNIPIAILSSRGKDKMRPNFWDEFDIVGYFTKPYLEDVVLNIVAKTLGINHQNQDLPKLPPAKNIPQTRFLAIGLNSETRKSLVALIRNYPQFVCSFFPEDEIINPDNSDFDYQSLMWNLKQRTRKNIHIPSSLFSLSKTCTFIPDHFLTNECVGYSISYPLYLVIDVKSFQSLQKIDFDFNFQELPVILIGDEKEVIAEGWNIQGCISDCEEIMDIIERR